MAKGAQAKIEVENIIRKAFKENFIGSIDKKLYVLANDGNEMVTICLSLTCPKNPVGVGGEENGMNFGASTVSNTPDIYNPAEISDKEMENVRNLIKELGL